MRYAIRTLTDYSRLLGISGESKGFLYFSTTGFEQLHGSHSSSDARHEGEVGLQSEHIAIWGANTDVGKTLVSSGLVLSALSHSRPVHYVKPVQTGFPADSDSRLVSKVVDSMCGDDRLVQNFTSSTLCAWSDAVSPHLAVGPNDSVDDQTLVKRIRDALYDGEYVTILETAGGPGSPGPSGKLQCDILRPLRTPVVLVGDGKLGGISTTLSSYEMMKIRGYSIPLIAILENRERTLENYKIVRANVEEDTVVVPLTACMLPEGDETPDPQLKEWLQDNKKSFDMMIQHLLDSHSERVSSLVSARKEALETIWWPFTQHYSITDENQVTVIDSRCGENIIVFSPERKTLKPLYDGCASWWTQGMNAEHVPGLAKHVAEAIGRYGHVIFPRNVHRPALDLAKSMVKGVGAPWASRAFFSDNGSTAVEVGLKMAFRKYMKDHDLLEKEEIGIDVLGLHGAYHGDTLGTMNAVAPSVFNGRLQTPWFQGRGLFLEPPIVYMRQGKWVGIKGNDEFEVGSDDVFVEDQERRAVYVKEILASIDRHVQETNNLVGACIIEPVVQGAGGMRMIDPEYHRAMADVCTTCRIPIIVDEVFTGIWRLGVESATLSLLNIRPDIGCYAKLLTGGVVPMALTLASEEVFEAFGGDSKAEALLHGHSYTANPVGCSAGLYSLRTMGSPDSNANICTPIQHTCNCSRKPGQTCGKMVPLWDSDAIHRISHLPRVQGIFALGTVVSVQLKSSNSGYGSNTAVSVTEDLMQRGIYARPLGDVVYIMVTPFTSKSRCKSLLNELETALT